MPRYRLHVKKNDERTNLHDVQYYHPRLLRNKLLTFQTSTSQFTAATRGGLIGLSVAGHVMEESKSVIVHATTPHLQTEDKTAAGWDELKSQGHVTRIRRAQVNNFATWTEIFLTHV